MESGEWKAKAWLKPPVVSESYASTQRWLRSLAFHNDQLRTDCLQLQLETLTGGEVSEAGHYASAGTFQTHQEPVSGISVNANNIVVTCSWDSWIHVFDLVKWQDVQGVSFGGDSDRSPQAGTSLLAVASSPCKPELVGCAAADSRAWLWNMENHTMPLQVLAGHDGAVNDIDFHAKQSSVACTAGDDRKAILWDCAEATKVRELPQHTREVGSVRFLCGPAYEFSVATGCCDHHVRLWDLRAPTLQCALLAEADLRLTLAVHGSNHLVAAGSDNGAVSIWDLRKLRRLQWLDLQSQLQGGVTSLAFAQDCSHMAVGSSTGTVLALDVEQRRWHSICKHGDAVFGLAWGQAWPWRGGAEQFLLCSSHDGTWSAWVPAQE